MKRAALYARVSTNGQTTENQLRELREVAKRNGWEVAGEYVDHGISGAKGADQRPALAKLMKAAVRREVDVILAWSVDRLGRPRIERIQRPACASSGVEEWASTPSRERPDAVCRPFSGL